MNAVWAELEGLHAYPELFTRPPEALPAERPDLFVQEDIPPILGRELQVVIGLPKVEPTLTNSIYSIQPPEATSGRSYQVQPPVVDDLSKKIRVLDYGPWDSFDTLK